MMRHRDTRITHKSFLRCPGCYPSDLTKSKSFAVHGQFETDTDGGGHHLQAILDTNPLNVLNDNHASRLMAHPWACGRVQVDFVVCVSSELVNAEDLFSLHCLATSHAQVVIT